MKRSYKTTMVVTFTWDGDSIEVEKVEQDGEYVYSDRAIKRDYDKLEWIASEHLTNHGVDANDVRTNPYG